MPLCAICKTIPFRKILTGDLSLPKKTIKESSAAEYYTRSHDSIPELIAGGKSCELCKALARTITTGFWYANMKRDADMEMPVWLCYPVAHRSPAIWIYIGKYEPETRVFGQDLAIYVTLDNPMADTITAHRYVQESPTQGTPLKQIDSWLHECNEEHPDCLHVVQEQMQLPTRVLDVDSLPRRESMSNTKNWHDLFAEGKCKLVEHHAQEKGQYVALSYCWGTSLAYKTVKGNREYHRQGIDFARLPKSLQDAIFITRYLNLRYIWIDCLCIVQDDRVDWEREASNMANIYSKSYLTIAAARASHSAEGFLGSRKIKEMDMITFQDEEGPFRLYFYAQEINFTPGSIETISSEPLHNEPLSKRVWTLQERLLPVRTLHFAADQMQWECANKSQTEEGGGFGVVDEDFRLQHIISGLRSTSLAEAERLHWYRLIKAYTSRNLTYLSDKLPALSGVLAAIQRETNDICYAGIWGNHFLEGLLWRLEDPNLDSYVMVPKTPKRPDFWRAPSWSFAAVEGVILKEFGEFKPNYCATLEECSVTPVGSNPFGELKAGFARLRGPLTVIEEVERHEESISRNCLLRLRDQARVKAKVFFDFEIYENAPVLMITPYAGLALKHMDPGGDQFARVGIVQIWKDPDSRPLSISQLPEPTTIVLF
ncbi:HET-domain-containing protein [Lentithecium fluviatile CBS 122367]|uniref:HET-domain-containing protein n=1 Tax=Lentithecium fluviatile CBS 122367 TaxID=1168545 RepID=A0A6G1JBT6_9PLEO|nr:HET-domain-containing protein [Lentithecium fluviatile CBS 122367]